MVIELSPKIKREVSATIDDYGYKDMKEFIEDALRRRILELRKAEFLDKIKGIRKKIKKVSLTEEEISKDFDRFFHRK